MARVGQRLLDAVEQARSTVARRRIGANEYTVRAFPGGAVTAPEPSAPAGASADGGRGVLGGGLAGPAVGIG